MTKKRWRLLAAVLALIALGVAMRWCSPAPEPIYEGHPFSYWLQGFDPYKGANISNFWTSPTLSEANEAVDVLGTNAIPVMLRMLVYQPSPLLPPLRAIGNRLHLVKDRHIRPRVDLYSPYTRNYEAQIAFVHLGIRAVGAVPELIRLYDAHPDASTRTSILYVLSKLGPEAKEAIPVFLRGMNDPCEYVRFNAACALSRMHADAALVVPALIDALHDPSVMVRENAIMALSQLGAKATAAVPALLQFLHDAKYDPTNAIPPPMSPGRTGASFGGFAEKKVYPPLGGGSPAKHPDMAASALWAIDPDAAAKAHLKRPE